MTDGNEYVQYHLRLKAKHLTLLERRAKSKEKTVADEIRDAIRSYLGEA